MVTEFNAELVWIAVPVWTEKERPAQADALRGILFAWLVTLPVAAGLAAVAIQLFQMF